MSYSLKTNIKLYKINYPLHPFQHPLPKFSDFSVITASGSEVIYNHVHHNPKTRENMKSVVSERAALTSQNKMKIWKKLPSIAGAGLLSFGITLTLFNTVAIKAFAHPAATEINTTQEDTGTKAETKQRRSGRQYPTLRRNNKGLEVEYLQLRLREWGYYRQNITGIFGADTENAVKRFQQDSDIFPTGVVDSQTWNAIERKPNTSSRTSQRCNRPTLQPGASGEDVRELQQRLYDLGYLKIRPSSYFGQATKQALIRYQQQQDLPATGTVNARTWEALKLSCKAETVFVVVIPVKDRFTLADVKDYVSGAFVYNTQDGSYVNAGQFPNQQDARRRADFLRGKGFDTQLIRRSNS